MPAEVESAVPLYMESILVFYFLNYLWVPNNSLYNHLCHYQSKMKNSISRKRQLKAKPKCFLTKSMYA